ncbi:MAG: PhnD/SsuA/transferrin family substrate-binding protein [Deltaproteobacteria bacterium]|nr:PhnD/SsuA/transferrin family substrate-binding protein [Deltaproteobacteria bacterium]
MKTRCRISYRMGILILVLLCALPAAATSTDLLLLLPGFPGTSAQAQPFVDKMLRFLEVQLNLQKESMRGVFITDGSQATIRLEQMKPGIALLGPSIYAQHAKEMRMTVIARVEANGRGEQKYHVIVPKDGPDNIHELSGIVSGSVVHDEKFVCNVLLNKKVSVQKLTMQNNPRPLRALRSLSEGKVSAVIVDEETLKYMSELEFSPRLKKIYTTDPVPAPAVVVLNDGRKFAQKLKKSLVGLCQTTEGKALCQSLTISSISPANDADYKALLKKYRR